MRAALQAVRRGWPAVVMVVLAACTSGSRPGPAPSGTKIVSPPTPTDSPMAEPFVRTCEESVYGDLGSDWRTDSLQAGPIAFVGLGSADGLSTEAFEIVEGKFRSIKVLAVVDVGAEVTVSVPASDRPHAALLYDPSAFREDGLYALSDGDPEVTFRSCAKGENPFLRFGYPEGPTQFNGALIVDGPRCLRLDVTPAGEPPIAVVIPLGVGSCEGSA